MVYDMVRLALSLLACMCAIFALVRSIHELIIAKSEKKKRRKSSIAEYKELQAASGSTYTAQVYKTVQGFSVRLNIELQNRFIPGRSAYETARSNGNLRSIIFRDAAGLQKLLDEKAGRVSSSRPIKREWISAGLWGSMWILSPRQRQ